MKTIYVLGVAHEGILTVFDDLELVDQLIEQLKRDWAFYEDWQEEFGEPCIDEYYVDEIRINTFACRRILNIDVVNGVITKKEKLDNKFYEIGKGYVE